MQRMSRAPCPCFRRRSSFYGAIVERRLLTRAAYDALGRDGRSGLAVAMATKADATLAVMDPDEQRVARRIFLRLVQFGEGRPDTRRQLGMDELRAADDAPGVFDRVFPRLIDNRLLTSTSEGADGRRVDIAHEMLIVGWPASRQWVRARREAEITRRRLEAKAREWVRLGRGSGGLLDADELPEADRWLQSPDAAELGIDSDVQDLVRASRDRLERERALALRRTRAIVAGLTCGLILISLLGLWGDYKRRAAQVAEGQAKSAAANEAVAADNARSQTLKAERNLRVANGQRLATSSQLAISKQPVQSLLLAVEAIKATRDHGDPVTTVAAQALQDALSSVQGRPFAGHEDRISAMVIAPDGRLVTGISDGTVRVWDVNNPGSAPLVLREQQSKPKPRQVDRITYVGNGAARTVRVGGFEIKDLAFASDGRLIALGSDGYARVWDLKNSDAPPLVLLRHGGSIRCLAMAPDGRLVTGGNDGMVWVWDLKKPDSAPLVLRGARGPISALRLRLRRASSSPVVTTGRYVCGTLKTPPRRQSCSEGMRARSLASP